MENADLPGIIKRGSEPPNPGLRPLLSFLRRPEFVASVPGRLTSRGWLGWMGLLLLVSLLAVELDRILIHAFHWPVPVRSGWEYFLTTPSWSAFGLLLVAPAVEEVAFRSFLSAAPEFVFTGLAFFAVYVYFFIHANVPAFSTPISTSTASILIRYFHQFWLVVPAGAVSWLLYRYRRDAVLAFFRRRASWIFWASCILFGAGHGLLYSNHLAWWRFALVTPQFLVGVGLAYIRVRFGLRWSIASHYAIDVLFTLQAWLFYWAWWSRLDAPPASLFALLHGMSATVTMVRFALMAYGVVVLWRVARFRC